jgi:hypothetical protein
MSSCKSLFYERPRDYFGPSFPGENAFNYLDRSARPHAAIIREFFNDQLETYPDDQRHSMVKRLTSGNDVDFRAAEFELLLYGAFKKMGLGVEVEPEMPNGKRIDFLIEDVNGFKCYVEATNMETAPDARAGKKNNDRLITAVQREVDFGRLRLLAIPSGLLTGQESFKKLFREISAWVRELELTGGTRPVPVTRQEKVFRIGSFQLRLVFLGLRANRPEFNRLSWMENSMSSQLPDRVKGKLEHKNSKYGQLDHPLLIGLNLVDWTVDHAHATEALYGTRFGEIREDCEGALAVVPVVLDDGIWTRKRTSSVAPDMVWIFENASLWNISSKHFLHLKPGLSHPRLSSLASLPLWKGTRDKLEVVSGQSISDLIGLPVSSQSG